MRIHFGHGKGQLVGVVREGAEYPQKGVLLLHPHPLYGGSMDNYVITILDEAFFNAGFTTLRFDFRGVQSVEGQYEGPQGAITDAITASLYMHDELKIEHMGIIGYSFGGSIAIGLALNVKADFLITLSASLELLRESGVNLESLDTIRCPILMFHGTDDRMVPYHDMIFLSTKFGRHVEEFSIDGEGHFYTNSMTMVKEKILLFTNDIWSDISPYD